MTKLNELINELRRDSLLDEGVIKFMERPIDYDLLNLATHQTIPDVPKEKFLSFSDDSQQKLPNFDFLQLSNKDSILEANQMKNVLTDIGQDSSSTLHQTKNLIKHKTRRHKVVRVYENGRHCKDCAISLSPLSIHCPYCRERVISNFAYFGLMAGSAIFLTAFVLVIFSVKFYR